MEADLVARRRTVHETPETGWAEFIATARAAEFFTSLGFKVMVGRGVHRPHLRARPLRRRGERVRAPCEGRGRLAHPAAAHGRPHGAVRDVRHGPSGQDPCVPRRARRPSRWTNPSIPTTFPTRKASPPSVPASCTPAATGGHQAVAFELGRFIVANRDRLTGRIRFIFQPGEEGSRGAYPIVQSGLLDDVDTLLCAHIATDLQAGTVVAAPESSSAPRRSTFTSRACRPTRACSPSSVAMRFGRCRRRAHPHGPAAPLRRHDPRQRRHAPCGRGPQRDRGPCGHGGRGRARTGRSTASSPARPSRAPRAAPWPSASR